MRTYDARCIALTVGVHHKWVDNLLSHHQLPGVLGGRQGVQRQVSFDGLVAIEVTRMLATELQMPLATASVIAAEAVRSRLGNEFRVTTGGGVMLRLAAAEIESRLRTALIDAVESVPRVRRGRPSAHTPSTTN